MQEQFIRIEGMSCKNCVKHVDEILTAIDGVEGVEVSLEQSGATVRSSAALDLAAVRQALDDAGYDLVD